MINMGIHFIIILENYMKKELEQKKIIKKLYIIIKEDVSLSLIYMIISLYLLQDIYH